MFFNLRTAGIAESEHLRDFVERFAGRIIDRAANQSVMTELSNQDQDGVSTTDDERNVRRNCGTGILPVITVRHRQPPSPTGYGVPRDADTTFKEW